MLKRNYKEKEYISKETSLTFFKSPFSIFLQTHSNIIDLIENIFRYYRENERRPDPRQGQARDVRTPTRKDKTRT